MPSFAVLPVKRFDRAKRRLTAGLDAPARESLAEAMVSDVLAALALVPAIERVLVVSAEPRTRALAAAHGAAVIDDPQEAGQSAAAGRGIAQAMEWGADRVLLVPGDCPALEPAEVTDLLARHESRGVVVVPDRHGAGTNALLLSPPDVIAPAFGPESCARHARAAEDAGETPVVAEIPSLALDIDTPADLRALVSSGGAARGTAAVLNALERAGQPALDPRA